MNQHKCSDHSRWQETEKGERKKRERASETDLQISSLLCYSSPSVLPSKLQLVKLLLSSILLTSSWNAALPFTDSCYSCQQQEKGKEKATSRWQTVASRGKSPWSQASKAEVLFSLSLPFHAMLSLGLGKKRTRNNKIGKAIKRCVISQGWMGFQNSGQN